VSEQTLAKLVFPALIEILFQFFESEVNYVVVVQFFGRDIVAETQPETVQQVDFVGGKIRRVRAKNLVNLVAIRKMDFQIELRLGIGKLFPSFADLPRLLFALPFARGADHNRGRLQAVAGAQNTIPEVVGRDNGEANGLAAFFRHGKGLGK